MGKGEIGLPKLVLLGMTQYFSQEEKSTAGNWENVGRLYDHHKNRSRFYTKNKSRNFAVKLSTCAKKSTRVFFSGADSDNRLHFTGGTLWPLDARNTYKYNDQRSECLPEVFTRRSWP